MVAADTSSLLCFLAGHQGSDVDALRDALRGQILLVPPVVVTELLSDPGISKTVGGLISNLPLLPVEEGFWSRAGASRARLLKKKLKSRVADALIAQSCLDAGLPLITRDEDFRHYEKYCGLKVIWG